MLKTDHHLSEQKHAKTGTNTNARTHKHCLSDGFMSLPLSLQSNPCFFNGLLASPKRKTFAREWGWSSAPCSSLTWDNPFNLSVETMCLCDLSGFIHLHVCVCSLVCACASRSGLLICGYDDPVSPPPSAVGRQGDTSLSFLNQNVGCWQRLIYLECTHTRTQL